MPKINREEYEILTSLDERAKSIVRQDGGRLWVAEQPIMKDDIGWYVEDGFDVELEDDEIHLFQFIQWEDEEPHNIQELIEDFEEAVRVNKIFENSTKMALKESEETEVKTLESIREEIWEEMLRLEDKRKDQWADIKYQTLREVLQKLGHLDEPEVLSSDWISKNVEYAYFDMLDDSGRLSSATAIIRPEKLKKLIVPKQEEVDQAYKSGYETGKQHTFYKGYLEGLTEGERKTNEYFESITEEPSKEQVWKYLSEHGIEVVDKEPETVADVVADFFKSLERLKEVMSMEVEELEE